VRVVSFGEGGDVQLVRADGAGEVRVSVGGRILELRPSFHERHNLINLLAAVGCAHALGVEPQGPLEVGFSAMRGERLQTDAGIVLINDCYNANPMSMRAAIDELAATAPGRRVAVLGDMLELGPQAPELHRQLGAHAAWRGVDLLVTVGPLAENMLSAFAGDGRAVADADAAAEALGGLLRSGDTVLVKGSRGVALERVAEALGARAETGRTSARASEAAPAAGARRR
jgi:UDP-N-acetylmuramoyl-tripeptide--D-alanyl-D-alanine ligase